MAVWWNASATDGFLRLGLVRGFLRHQELRSHHRLVYVEKKRIFCCDPIAARVTPGSDGEQAGMSIGIISTTRLSKRSLHHVITGFQARAVTT
jgi:hypothetical protein